MPPVTRSWPVGFRSPESPTMRKSQNVVTWLASVDMGDIMLNAELVRQGYAQVATFPPNVNYQEFCRQLKREAREVERGL